MSRQPKRQSGMKALQAIKQTSNNGRIKVAKVSQICPNIFELLMNLFYSQKQTVKLSENPRPTGVKRSSSPGSINPPAAKRNALGDVTNVKIALLDAF